MFRFIKGFLFFAAFLFLFGFIGMSLWNALIPELFHGPMLTYWQTLGLLLLAKIFFGCKGGGHHRGWHGGHKHWGHGGWGGECGPQWAGWKEQYEKMTPEEKEAWKAKMKDQWRSGWGEWEKPENKVSGNQ
jgi:hypothetical protein